MIVAGAALGLGSLIYAANRPQELLAAKLLPLRVFAVNVPLLRVAWVRNHAADALFALAVGALLAWWSTRNQVSARATIAIGAGFLLALECVGTFDPIDIVVELAVFGMALFAMRAVRPTQSPQT